MHLVWSLLASSPAPPALRLVPPPLMQQPQPKEDFDTAFASWREQQLSQDCMQRMVKQLAHPDVPLWLVFEGIALPTVLPGSATTDALHTEVTRLYNLDRDQKFRFSVCGATLPFGVAISESPLANSQDLNVHVNACEWPVRRGRGVNRAVPGMAATRARRNARPLGRPKHVKCPHLMFE